MTRIPVRLGAAALTVMLVIGVRACSEPTMDPDHPNGEVAVGQEFVVDLGVVNPSVGDAWELTSTPDPGVLKAGGSHIDYGSGNPPPGSPGALTVRFTAVGKGSTTLTYEYRYRGEKPADPAEQKTQTFQITVR